MIINKTFQSFKVNYYSIFTTKLMGNFNRYNHEFKHVNILSIKFFKTLLLIQRNLYP